MRAPSAACVQPCYLLSLHTTDVSFASQAHSSLRYAAPPATPLLLRRPPASPLTPVHAARLARHESESETSLSLPLRLYVLLRESENEVCVTLVGEPRVGLRLLLRWNPYTLIV